MGLPGASVQVQEEMTVGGVRPIAELSLLEVDPERKLRPATWMNGSKD